MYKKQIVRLIIYVQGNYKTLQIKHESFHNIKLREFNSALENCFSLLNAEKHFFIKCRVINFSNKLTKGLKKIFFSRLKSFFKCFLVRIVLIQSLMRRKKVLDRISIIKQKKLVIIQNYKRHRYRQYRLKVLTLQKHLRGW